MVGGVDGGLVGWGKTPSNPEVKLPMFIPEVLREQAGQAGGAGAGMMRTGYSIKKRVGYCG